MVRLLKTIALSWLLLSQPISAIQVDITNTNAVKATAKTIASGMVDYYMNQAQKRIYSNIPGYLPGPYYWWECGAMFGALIDYFKYTGDTTFNPLVSSGIQFQVGPNKDFMPPNATQYLGNDDQGFWALSAMSAAETNFDAPPDKSPSWLSLAQAVFNEQSNRWDTSTCGGGMRWQSIPVLAGWNLKNSISNGIYFQLGARLARYTGNDTYAQLATRTYDWMTKVHLIDKNYNVFDNSEADKLNCTQLDHNQWSYNAGTMLVGAAYMYNYTNGSALWQNRTTNILNRTIEVMFPSGIMTEICEENNACNVDQHSFKAYLSRWLAATTQLAPYTYDRIIALMRTNAKAAVAQCTGSSTGPAAGFNIGTACGLKWDNGTWDGSDGVGQQMAVLEVLLATLISKIEPPLTGSTGGTSESNPSAGSGNTAIQDLEALPVATYRDRVGAGILTAVLVLAGISAMIFMWSDAWEYKDRLDNALAGARSSALVLGAASGKGMPLETRGADALKATAVTGGDRVEDLEEKNSHTHPDRRRSYLERRASSHFEIHNRTVMMSGAGGRLSEEETESSPSMRADAQVDEIGAPNEEILHRRNQVPSGRPRSHEVGRTQIPPSSPVAPRPSTAGAER